MSDHFGNIPIDLPKPPSPPGKDEKPAATPTSAKNSERKGPGTSRKPRRIWYWLAFFACIFGLYNGIGFLGLPYYITRTLPESFQKTTGMILDPGQVTFNPYNFHFETTNVKILAEAGPTLLSLKTIKADLAPLSLLRLDLVCNTILIEEIVLNVTRESDGTYNLDRLLRREANANASEILDFSDLPFFFSLNNIAIKNSRVLFNDLPAGKTHAIENIQLDLPSLSNIPFRADRYIHPRFSAVINGSPVELTGQAHVGEPGGPGLATNLSFNLHALDLPVYSEYLPVELPFIFKKGKADGNLEFHFNPEAAENDKLSVGFDLQLSETELRTPDSSVVIAAPAAELKGKFQPVARMVLFSDIALREPAINSFGDSFLGNINKLIKREKSSSSAGDDAASPLSLATDSLILDNGLFRHYQSQNEKKPIMTWKALQLNIKNYSTVAADEKTGDFGSFRLSGEKEGTSSLFSWQGTFTSPENLNGSLNLIKMNFQEMLEAFGTEKQFTVQGTADLKGELTFPSSTESAATTGYKLSDGELSVQNFKLLENKQVVLSTPLLQATNLSTAGSTMNWGTIALQNGNAVFSAGKTPKFFSQFNTAKNRLQGLDIVGQATLLPEKKDKEKIQLTNISLKASNLETPEKSRDNFTLTARTETGGSLSCRGDMRIAPFALAVKSDFSGLAAEAILPYFTSTEFLNNLSGALAGSGTLTFPRRSYTGELRLAKANVRESAKTVYAWEDSVFQEVNYTAEPFHLGIALAAIEQPEYIWQIGKNDGDPLQRFASFFQRHLPKVEKQSDEKGKVAISPVDIQEVRINKATIRIQDNRTKPKWQGQITDFTGNIKNIHMSAAAPASDFAFIGILDEMPMSVQGSLDVFAKEQHGKYRATLENYPLASFHKQLSAQTDIDTSDGTFTLTLDATWQDGQLHNTGSMLFSGVKPISEKADSALTLALLTGPEDTFQLDFDLIRSLPAGKTVLVEDILSVFETKNVKSAVSPLLLASGDFSDLIGNEYAEFQPGEIQLSDTGRETLTRYSSLLSAHPYLGLLLSGGANKQSDSEALKQRLEAAELQRVDGLNRKRLEDWQKRKAVYEKKLQEQPKKPGPDGKFGEANMPADILAGFTPVQPEPVVVKDSMLLELAQKRQSVVYEFFTTQLGLEADRISPASPKRMADFQSEIPVTGVKIGLKAIKR